MHHIQLSISHTRFACFRFCLLCSKLESVENFLYRKLYHDAVHSFQRLEKACYKAWHSFRKRLYKDFTEQNKLQRVRRIHWWLQGHKGLEVYFDRSDKKRIPEFLGEIQAMIENDPSNFVARDKETSKFLFKLVIPERIRYFKIKRINFYYMPWRIRGKTSL